MANILKIRDVCFYSAMCEDAQECFEALKILKENNIPFKHMNWENDSMLRCEYGVLTNLSTWEFSSDRQTTFKKTFTKLPILHWDVIDENYEKTRNCADGLEEIKTCDVILHKDKIIPPVVPEPPPRMSEEELAEIKTQFLNKMVTKYTGSLTEEFTTLFDGETVSEDFRSKTVTTFENALKTRITKIVDDVYNRVV